MRRTLGAGEEGGDRTACCDAAAAACACAVAAACCCWCCIPDEPDAALLPPSLAWSATTAWLPDELPDLLRQNGLLRFFLAPALLALPSSSIAADSGVDGLGSAGTGEDEPLAHFLSPDFRERMEFERGRRALVSGIGSSSS